MVIDVCPFCGTAPGTEIVRGKFIILCENRGCRVRPICAAEYERVAVEAWNNRFTMFVDKPD